MSYIMENDGNLKPGRAILGAFLIAVIMRFFVFDFMIADGHSMEPAITQGSLLVVFRMQYGFRFPWAERYLIWWTLPREGDVLVFYTPSGVIAVKRFAGFADESSFIALGDNTLQSFDSRSYGPVPMDSIIGKVLGF